MSERENKANAEAFVHATSTLVSMIGSGYGIFLVWKKLRGKLNSYYVFLLT